MLSSWIARSFRVASGLALAGLTAAACAGGNAVMQSTGTSTGTGGGAGTGGGVTSASTSAGTGGGGATACIQNDCQADDECGACPNGYTICDTTSMRCVACGAGKTCPAGTTCSSFGSCVPAGATCPTSGAGVPTVTCTSSADCVACDPLHQVCDTTTSQCVACTSIDSSACQSTDQCTADACVPDCPSTCATDNDCAACGSTDDAAHACNAGKCSQCSATYACPSGQICSTQGVCGPKCGQDGEGSCYSDSDCAACAMGATQCHSPINANGQCGPQAAGCSDLGQGTVVLPSPWDKVTNLCSTSADCAGVGISIDVGSILRDLTGISEINDADLTYPMSVCAAVSVGSGSESLSCGVCVPCSTDADCQPIDVDTIAGEAFGPIGSVAVAVLLDEIFGPNDHEIHMYCQEVVAGYGVCAPCPGIVNVCGVN
jgi:hypothetical protein